MNKTLPSQVAQSSYSLHWENLKKYPSHNARFEQSWQEIIRLEDRYDWTGLLRSLRKQKVQLKIAG